MIYKGSTLKTEIVVHRIFSVHYYKCRNNFSSPGESHNFWELLFVDQGLVNVLVEAQTYTLQKGEIIFYKPNEFHNVMPNGSIAPSLIVIGFECDSPAMKFFEGKRLYIGEKEQKLLSKIIEESQTVFSAHLNDPYLNKLARRENAAFGAEHLIQMYLQELLILLIRANHAAKSNPKFLKSGRKKNESDTFNRIVSYMSLNINVQLTIEQICQENQIGRSILQKLFREYAGCSVMDYFTNLKISTAKQLIQDQQLNFTQIAKQLGYTSIHYFSRQFKKLTGMTPSQYAVSAILLTDSLETQKGQTTLEQSWQK